MGIKVKLFGMVLVYQYIKNIELAEVRKNALSKLTQEEKDILGLV